MFSIVNLLTGEVLKNLNNEPVILDSKKEAQEYIEMTYRHWKLLRIPNCVSNCLEIIPATNN